MEVHTTFLVMLISLKSATYIEHLNPQPCFRLKRFTKQRIDADPFRPGFDFMVADFGQTDWTVISHEEDGVVGAAHFVGGHQAARRIL